MLFAAEFSLVFILGLAAGSFSSALSYRIPRNIIWWGNSRSTCPHCMTTLGLLDLIPVFSWLFSWGKCRHCSESIHVQYPLIETVSALLALMAYWVVGFSPELVFIIFILPFLIAHFLIDLEFKILPNQLNFILFFAGLVKLIALFPMDAVIYGVLSAIIYGAVAWVLRIGGQYFLKKEALGFGDVKFFCVAGLWLGLPLLPYFMIGSGGLAVFCAAFWSWKYKSKAFPFGPALILSFYLLLLFGGSIVV